MIYKAYLIVICAIDDNRVLEAVVWSSPEWEQSRFMSEVRTYVAYATSAGSYAEAARHLLKLIADPVMGKRYHWLYQHVTDKTLACYGLKRGDVFEVSA